jgi:undecaprenyl-diphosphatase
MAKSRTATSYILSNRSEAQGLRAPGWLAQWPLIGILMFVVGISIFGAVAYNVTTKSPLVQWDMSTAQTMHADLKNVPSDLREYLVFGFFVGKELITVIGIILAIYFLYKRFWRELAMVLIGLGGAGVLWYSLSRYFDRPRPPTQTEIVLSDPSFPSGHAFSAVLCYGLLAYLLVPKMPSLFWKWFTVIMAVVVIAFIGYSRLMLGGHYVSDVAAGYALGLAWAGLIYTLIERFVTSKGRA